MSGKSGKRALLAMYDRHNEMVKRLRSQLAARDAEIARLKTQIADESARARKLEAYLEMSNATCRRRGKERDAAVAEIARLRGQLPAVAGDLCLTSLNEFRERGQLLLKEEQEKPLPNNALIDFICNAIRLARETEPKP